VAVNGSHLYWANSSSDGNCAVDARQAQPTTAQQTTAEAIWLCSAVVSLTAAEIAAALYAYSDLMDEVTDHIYKVLRDELHAGLAVHHQCPARTGQTSSRSQSSNPAPRRGR
jgi:hypothetical protein